ncbi:uncharacterized protein At3g49140-like isoform X2 [Impatiens glandulifera]|uniref:uncharacterized protein At3g49140-like isoform X2 n=1 Tax=Impatiens glandulifera TaxID=253017 RepID=UPI001FB0B1B8|nr:uncharacterized protein At3g49140-like isoform X2 [Impatiens glandulifera]
MAISTGIHHIEGIGCYTPYGVTSSWLKSPHLEFQSLVDCSGIRSFSSNSNSRTRKLFSGTTPSNWLPVGREICSSKVLVAADSSDSVPSSSSYINNHGYHPHEEIKACKRLRKSKLTLAESAKTAVEANNSAVLIFPSSVHCEPFEGPSWVESEYFTNDFGDIFFEIFDDQNILEDVGACNPVNVLIGMDMSMYKNKRLSGLEDIPLEDAPLIEEYYLESEEDDDSETEISSEWGMPMNIRSEIHPIYFSKCLVKSIEANYAKEMESPSNGISIKGRLMPIIEEELYLRRIVNDLGESCLDLRDNESSKLFEAVQRRLSIFYRLEITEIQLFSVYGVQSRVDLLEFYEAKTDPLVYSMLDIIEPFNERGNECNSALKSLCKKKGLIAENASLIGVDSLGMDVRILSGTEVQTHRFPFKAKVRSEAAAEKQIRHLLFPPARRKRLQNSNPVENKTT